MSGKHVEKYENGVYDGEFVNGKRHGKGKYKWADGAEYDGDWKDGNMDGKGRKKWADGNMYNGDW